MKRESSRFEAPAPVRRASRCPRPTASFTLVELLTVVCIMVILAGLTVSAGLGLMKSAARNRASAEVHAMSAALESYMADNGVYPAANYFANTNAYATSDPGSANYLSSAQDLYQSLAGRTNYNDAPSTAVKSYMEFKIDQLGNYSAAPGTTGSGSTYVCDPWGYPYGYSTGTNATPQQEPFNGYGFYDLWSTAGLAGGTSGGQGNTAAWIANWQQ